MVKDLSVNLCGVQLSNPVIPASGTFGFGVELAGSMDLDVLGGISLKGTTRDARYGNPTPRIAECSGGMINSVGLQNPGIDKLVGEKVPALRECYHGTVIANISGFSIEEYTVCCAAADAGLDRGHERIDIPAVVTILADLPVVEAKNFLQDDFPVAHAAQDVPPRAGADVDG